MLRFEPVEYLYVFDHTGERRKSSTIIPPHEHNEATRKHPIPQHEVHTPIKKENVEVTHHPTITSFGLTL